MIRYKFILIFTSLLLLGAMTLIDTRHYYLEGEELVESREAEREELKEAEGKNFIKLLSGGNGLPTTGLSYQLQQITCIHFLGIARHYSLITKSEIDLFLKYCCLKVHLG